MIFIDIGLAKSSFVPIICTVFYSIGKAYIVRFGFCVSNLGWEAYDDNRAIADAQIYECGGWASWIKTWFKILLLSVVQKWSIHVKIQILKNYSQNWNKYLHQPIKHFYISEKPLNATERKNIHFGKAHVYKFVRVNLGQIFKTVYI